IDTQALGADLAVGNVLLAQLGEVSTDNIQLAEIQTGIVIGALQSSNQALGGHVGSTQCQRAHSSVDDIGTGFNALQNGHGSKTGSIVAVNIDGDLDGLLQLLDQVVAGVGLEQAGHILDAD